MKMLAFFCCAAFLILQTSAAVSGPTNEREKVDVVAVTDECGANNPLYQLTALTFKIAMNVVVCENRTAPGKAEQKWLRFALKPGQPPQQLGCAIDSGVDQKFYVFWEEAAEFPSPDDVTSAANNITVSKTTSKPTCPPGGCNWWMYNANYFKPIQVTYTMGGRTRSEKLNQLRNTIMLGKSPSSPHIDAQFTSPYREGECVSGTDVYPPIKSIHRNAKAPE
jgi:hypothetical protein